MTIIRVQLKGIDELKAEFGDIAANQMPFASALTLTKTAKDAQGFIRSDVLPKNFTLRRAPFIKAGVRITAATKAKLEAVVQDIDAFMGLQETGGEKVPYKNAIAVPLEGARPTLGALIAASDRPHAVMANGGFIRNGIMYAVALKAGRRGSVSRSIKGIAKAADWSRQIIPMYVLVPKAALKARYGFEDAVRKIVAQNLASNFHDSFLRAVRTAKR